MQTVTREQLLLIYMKLSKKHKSLEIDHRELREDFEETKITANWNQGGREECEKKWEERLNAVIAGRDALSNEMSHVKKAMAHESEKLQDEQNRTALLLRRVDELQSRDESQSKQIEELLSTESSHQGKIRDMEATILELRNELQECKSHTMAIEKECTELKSTLDQTSEERDTALKGLEEKHKAGHALQQMVTTLRQSLDSKEKESGEGAASTQAILDDLNKKIVVLSESNRRLEAELATAGQQIEEGNMRFMSKMSEMNGLVENVRRCSVENATLKEQVAAASDSTLKHELDKRFLKENFLKFLSFEKVNPLTVDQRRLLPVFSQALQISTEELDGTVAVAGGGNSSWW